MLLTLDIIYTILNSLLKRFCISSHIEDWLAETSRNARQITAEKCNRDKSVVQTLEVIISI